MQQSTIRVIRIRHVSELARKDLFYPALWQAMKSHQFIFCKHQNKKLESIIYIRMVFDTVKDYYLLDADNLLCGCQLILAYIHIHVP